MSYGYSMNRDYKLSTPGTLSACPHWTCVQPSAPQARGVHLDQALGFALIQAGTHHPTLLLESGICAAPWSKNQGRRAGTLEMAVASLQHIMPQGD